MNENMRKIVERLEKHASPTPSKWREVFEYMDANETWLRYSQHIADARQNGGTGNESEATG